MSESFLLYQRLAKGCHYLLAQQQFIDGDIAAVQDRFVDDLWELMKSSFELSNSRDQFERFVTEQAAGDVASLSDEDLVRYMVSVVENERSYIIASSYFAEFIANFIKSMRPEFYGEAVAELERIGVGESALNRAKIEYRKLVGM